MCRGFPADFEHVYTLSRERERFGSHKDKMFQSGLTQTQADNCYKWEICELRTLDPSIISRCLCAFLYMHCRLCWTVFVKIYQFLQFFLVFTKVWPFRCSFPTKLITIRYAHTNARTLRCVYAEQAHAGRWLFSYKGKKTPVTPTVQKQQRQQAVSMSTEEWGRFTPTSQSLAFVAQQTPATDLLIQEDCAAENRSYKTHRLSLLRQTWTWRRGTTLLGTI